MTNRCEQAGAHIRRPLRGDAGTPPQFVRHRRRSGEDVPSLMCTCCHVHDAGSCEHMLYV